MKILKAILPLVIFKKLYSSTYSKQKQAEISDEEQDALDDAKADGE